MIEGIELIDLLAYYFGYRRAAGCIASAEHTNRTRRLWGCIWLKETMTFKVPTFYELKTQQNKANG